MTSVSNILLECIQKRPFFHQELIGQAKSKPLDEAAQAVSEWCYKTAMREGWLQAALLHEVLLQVDWRHIAKEVLLNGNPSPSVSDYRPAIRLQELVAEFHLAFGHPVLPGPALPDTARRALRIALDDEEYKELLEAERRNDFIESIDAQADLLYVILGHGLEYGISLPHIVSMPHCRYKSPPGFPPDGQRQDWLKTIDWQMECLQKAESQDDLQQIGTKLAGLGLVLISYAGVCGVDLGAVLQEVHRSNMSKLGADGKPIYREDGKALKGPNYTPPDIAKVIGVSP